MKKQINPMAIVLGRSFNEVSENVQTALVVTTENSLNVSLHADFKAACEAIKALPEGTKIACFTKAPFSRKFENGNKAIKNAMRHYFPEAAPVETDESDAMPVETVDAIAVVETEEIPVETIEKKKARKTKKSE